MPVQFGGVPAKTPQAPAASSPATAPASYTPPQHMAPSQSSPAPHSGPAVSFLMQGNDAHAALKEEEAKAALAQSESGKLWRFFISQKQIGQDFTLTFLDGALGPDGLLQMVSWYEHSFMLGGRLQHFVCVGGSEPCPMCSGGSERTLMFGFTVIDHTPYTIKKGDKEGQVIPWSRKLFVCKKKTASQLQLVASKIGGLNGCQLTVVRSGNMAPNVGDTLFPVQRFSAEELAANFGDQANPADWGNELTYRTAAELIQAGVAEAVKTVQANGQGSSPGGHTGGSKNFTSAF